MIINFNHKGLQQLYETGSQKGVNPEHAKRLRIILARLGASQSPEDMNLPGLRLHSLKGNLKGFWAFNVSGNWRISFRFKNNNVVDVDYDDYH
jgi:proteic killer suppression protein